VCDSLIGTLLNIQGKTKDDARLDLVEMKIQEYLAPRRLVGVLICPLHVTLCPNKRR